MPSKSSRVETPELHRVFLEALGDSVIHHSDPQRKPLEIDLSHPLPSKIRVYIYTATHPVGGRPECEHKIQLIVPDQEKHEKGDFDHSDGRIVILAGFEPELEVFILWDANLYEQFAYSRNVQVKGPTVYAALAGRLATQERCLRNVGPETVVAARKDLLCAALRRRYELSVARLARG
jgi:hypothetical protein